MPTKSPTFAGAASNSGGIFDFAAKAAKLEEIDRELEDPKVWDNAQRAQDLGKEKKSLEAAVLVLRDVENRLKDAGDLFELARAEEDDDTVNAVEADLGDVEKEVADLEFRRMFANPADPNNCFVDIQAGAGGTEACDWASMLLRQYLKYCERKGFKAEVLEQTDGDVAGIRSASLKVEGDYAYGFLRTETGVHRLVRKSPFDSSGGRHTSFASLFVYPEVDDSIEVEINPADLRIDTFRASGAGGQHINKTDSAIRITHLPSGTVVECQDERSQHKNRARALSLLAARLLDAETSRQQSAQAASRRLQVGSGDRSERIRTYNFPQGRITDHRINLTLYRLGDVIDGALDELLEPLRREDEAERLATLAD